MLDLGLPPGLEPLVNLVFLCATGYIAWHGVRFRNEDGEQDFVRLLFSCIAGVFFMMVLLQDVLKVTKF